MPILIALKVPRINLFAEGEIKDEDEKRWDEIFHNQVLIVKNSKGKNTLIPLAMDCNIAVMEEMTEEQLKEIEEASKKRKEEGQGGPVITKPQFLFPSGKKGPGRG